MDSRGAVVFKGTRDGIKLLIDEKADFAAIINDLRAKLRESSGFWQGASVSIGSLTRELNDDERSKIADTMREFGLSIASASRREGADGDLADSPAGSSMGSKKTETAEQTLIVRRTMRSGQRVNFDGNVVVLGDVNPGAEIVASGDIIVLGTLRGVAHAGALGNESAIVFGLKLDPTQLRIAFQISRAPDEKVASRPGPELACISEGSIVVKTYSV